MKNKETVHIYTNEIIRVTYKCNWSCKFCNVLKTNNYWKRDITYKEVISKILLLIRKYSKKELANLILSFSWWEPTLDDNLLYYVKLAKLIWVWKVQIQTNWTRLFKDKNYINKLIAVWLDEIFLAQHSWDNYINKDLWCYFSVSDFIDWVKYIKDNNIYNKISICLNIVITKINIYSIYNYIKFLLDIWFISIMSSKSDNWKSMHEISFWLVQPNWYAKINKDKVLLKFNKKELNEIKKIVKLCETNNIVPDFHFTSPPLCILEYPEYNLEYSRLKQLKYDKDKWIINKWNLDSYKWLWKEKQKFDECKKCKYNNYCLWFYKNWVNFVWEDYIKEKILSFLKD